MKSMTKKEKFILFFGAALTVFGLGGLLSLYILSMLDPSEVSYSIYHLDDSFSEKTYTGLIGYLIFKGNMQLLTLYLTAIIAGSVAVFDTLMFLDIRKG